MSEPSNEVAGYRLVRAQETMEEAWTLLREKQLRGATNRLYYAIFNGTKTKSLGQETGFGSLCLLTSS